MDEQSFDKLMCQRRDAAGSSLPANFQQNVWREIRTRHSLDTSAFGACSVWQQLLRPQFVTALLVIAILVGISLGRRQHDPVASSATQALHLDVFGAAAPTLPSTLLASNL
jgi:hypothetical protein